MKSPTILYSINGEGRYTSKEIRQIFGKPKMSVTGYAVDGKEGIEEVAYKRYRIVRNGKVYATGRTLEELAGKVNLTRACIQSRKSRPQRYATRKFTVEEYWEDL